METIDSVKVRMYRHGFGDCFLLRFLSKEKQVTTMLIDCGLKLNDKVKEVPIENVIKDISSLLKKEPTDKNPSLDVLVATHEHWDHISAFHPDAKHFDNFDIERLWMAWTENPADEDAKQINSTLTKRIKALKIAAEKLAQAKEKKTAGNPEMAPADKSFAAREQYEEALQGLIEFYGPLGVTKTSSSGISVKDSYKISIDTQRAIDHLRSLIKGKFGIKYFTPGTIFHDERVLPGIRIYMLGPPKSALLNKDKPSSGSKKEVYYSLSDTSLTGFVDGLLQYADGEQNVDDGKPFDQASCIGVEEAKKHPYYGRYFDKENAWQTIDEDYLDVAGALALQMDHDTNNTSLVMAIEFIKSGKVMLFPGDAQVGNWLSWHDYTFKVDDNGITKTMTAEDLLAKTVLYKVGHHASHNATLKEKGLELMISEDLIALVPEKEEQYNNIPFPELMTALNEKTKGRVFVSADKNFPAEAVLKNKPDNLSPAEWVSLKKTVDITELYIEVTIKG